MKKKWILNSANPSRAEDLTFTPDVVMVMNPTPYSCLLREGNLNTPTHDSYDYLVPPGLNVILPITAPFFAAALDIRRGAGSAVFQMPCVLVFMANEVIPTFGDSSYRQTQRIDHSVNVGDMSSDILDCRAARGMLLSIRNKNPYVYNSAHAVAGVVEIITANDPDDFGTDAEKLTRTIPLPLSVQSVESVIPLAANFVDVKIHNYYGVVNPLHVQADVALLDTIPPFRPRVVTEYVSQQWTAGTTGFHVLLEQYIQAAIPYVDVIVFPATLDGDYDIELQINQIQGVAGTGESFRLSRTNRISGITGHRRQPAYFLGRDGTTGAMQYRIPCSAKVDRYVQLVMYVITPPASVHYRVPFEMEI